MSLADPHLEKVRNPSNGSAFKLDKIGNSGHAKEYLRMPNLWQYNSGRSNSVAVVKIGHHRTSCNVGLSQHHPT